MARDGNAKGMKETKFKDTVLGKIPEEWSVAQVGDLFSMKRNNTLSRDNLNYSDLAGYKNIHYGDVLVKFGAFIDISTDTLPFVNHDIKFNPDLLENGDVIIADTAEDETVGKASEVIGISAKDKVVSGLHTMILHPNEKFASKYLGYFLNGEAYHNSLYNSMQGTKVISISKKAINATSIAYPSLSEQQRVASALSDADALVAELDALIEKKRAIMAGIMQELLTGKRRLQGFSEPWVERTIEDFAKITTGASNTQDQAPFGIFPFYIRSASVMKSNRFLYDCEGVITIGDGQIGKVFHYINGKFDLHQRCYLIYDFYDVDAKFFYYIFSAFFYERAIALSAKATVDSVRRDMIAKMKVDLPSLAEQRAIASILSDMDAEIAELEAKRDKYKEVRQGMMQQLLTGKIRLI